MMYFSYTCNGFIFLNSVPLAIPTLCIVFLCGMTLSSDVKLNCGTVCTLLVQNSFNWSVDYVFQAETYHVSYITM